MNENTGLIGRKVGMIQVLEEDGTVIPCTVIQANAVVLGKRTLDKDGYTALILGLGERKEKRTTKPLAGLFKKAGVTPKQLIRELRCTPEALDTQEVGQPFKLEGIFEQGQFVDVQAVSRGKGFAGVIKRHNFKGSPGSHGTHEYFRHPGSIGTNMTPGRVLPGRKLPGQMGNKVTSVLNQKVVRIVPEENAILVRGGVPGGAGTAVVVRGAIKKKNGGRV
ncbi:MAG: 50S ribosomal protein L3 [Sorangiineae bacterium NIC37A_2]|nr:MAG: 50S ribosomal protein L3 [Sorangiineae bacterium NIC37A_2]